MDPQVWVRERIATNQPEMAWKPGSEREMRDWQRKLRARLKTLLGHMGDARDPLKAQVHERKQLKGYTRETVRFESRPGFEVFAYFLVPDGLKGRAPAVICLPGHGRGVDSVVGIAADGSQRELGANEEYQSDFALQCVQHGYVAVAIEQVSFGHRRDAKADKQGGGASSCVRDSMAALMFGETMTGWRVWDAMRAIDYAISRPEVDPKRIATMGISGGGLTSLFTACVDTRVRAAVVSGYFNTFASSILAVDHCPDNYVPGLLRLVEMPDMAGLVAPRALFAEGGTKDNIFPKAAFQGAAKRAEDIYGAFGMKEQFAWEQFEGDHEFHGTEAFKFLKRTL